MSRRLQVEIIGSGGATAAQGRHIEAVQVILDALMGREPTEAEWESVPPLAALRAIEQTLEADGAK